jgi:hypothetical protein
MAYPKSLYINRMAAMDPTGRYRTASQQFSGTRDGQRSKYHPIIQSKARTVWDGKDGTASSTGNTQNPYTFAW